MKRLFLMLCLVFAAVPSWAATVNLAVNPNPEADWASDNLYRAPGACSNPGAFAKVGSAIKSTAPTFADIVAADGTYCYKSTALDTAGNESIFSNTAEAVVNLNPPGAPPNLRVISVTP